MHSHAVPVLLQLYSIAAVAIISPNQYLYVLPSATSLSYHSQAYKWF